MNTTISDETQTLDIALGASIDDVVELTDGNTSYMFGTHAAIYGSDGHDFYLIRNETTGDVEVDGFDTLSVAEHGASMGLSPVE